MEELYKEFIIELYKNPRNFGTIGNPDYHSIVFNPACGDRIELFLKTDGEKVIDAKFSGDGCAISQASASLFTGFLNGKSIDELDRIAKEDVLNLLRIDLSKNPTRMKCALLPLDALRKAIAEK